MKLPVLPQNLEEAKLPEHIANPDPKRYLSDNFLVFDYESTNRDKGSALNRANRLVLATWVGGRNLSGTVDRHNQVYYKFGDEYHQEELADSIRSADFIVAHHSKFELQWGHRSGIECGSKLVWDTLLGEFVLAGNRRWPLSLEATAKRYGLSGKESKVRLLIEGGVCPSEVPRQWLLEYGCEDTNLCRKIFLLQRQRIVDAGLLAVMYTRCLLTPILADIEMQGVQLDAKRVEEEYERTASQHRQCSQNLERASGGLNWRSGDQVGSFIYDALRFEEPRNKGEPDRTATGKRRTDSDTVARLRAQTPAQKSFLELYKDFKKLDKKLTTLEKLKACVDQDGGRLYAQFNQAVAGTHRLTSSGLKHKVQFQNIDHTIKELFKARHDGWLVGEGDGIQLEFRVAAHLGRDPVALADIRDPNFDVHWQTAEQLTGKHRSELKKETDRYNAKPSSFRPLYGATSGSPAERRYIKFFQERYKGIYDTQTRWTYEVLKEKQLRTETGLIFYWPDTEIEGSQSNGGRGYIRNRTAIFNYPVQSLATADIIPIALVYFYHRAKALGLKLFLVNTIHDSIVAEIPPDELDQFASLVRTSFTVDCFDYLNLVYGIRYTVPIGVSWKVSSHWSLGKEENYDYDPDSRGNWPSVGIGNPDHGMLR